MVNRQKTFPLAFYLVFIAFIFFLASCASTRNNHYAHSYRNVLKGRWQPKFSGGYSAHCVDYISKEIIIDEQFMGMLETETKWRLPESSNSRDLYCIEEESHCELLGVCRFELAIIDADSFAKAIIIKTESDNPIYEQLILYFNKKHSTHQITGEIFSKRWHLGSVNFIDVSKKEFNREIRYLRKLDRIN